MLESLGKVLGVQTPTASSLITLASVAMERDFRKEGRTVDALGVENIRMILDDYRH